MAARVLPADRSAIAYEDRGFHIPYRMAIKIDSYIDRGEPVGDFLAAVISNDLAETCAHADPENLHNLPAFAAYFYNYAPSPCWGSALKMDAWLSRFQIEAKR